MDMKHIILGPLIANTTSSFLDSEDHDWVLLLMSCIFLLKYLFPLTLLIKHWLENYSLQHSSGLTNGRLVVIIHLSGLLTSLLVLLPSYPSFPILGSWEQVVVHNIPWGSFPIPGPIHIHREVFMGVVFGRCLLALQLWVLHTCLWLGQLLLPEGIAAHPYCWVYHAISQSTRGGGYQYPRALSYLTGSAEWSWQLEQKINLKQFVWKAIYLRTNKKQPSALKWMLISDWRVGGF